MRLEFGSAGAVCSKEKSSDPQNLQVSIVLKASISVGGKGDVPKIHIPCKLFQILFGRLLECLLFYFALRCL